MTNETKKINDSDLRDLLSNPKLNHGGQYVCDCPFCGKEKHFYISKQTQLFDCKKCGEYGSVYKLLRQLDKTYLLGGSTVESRDTIDKLRDVLENDSITTDAELKPLPRINMPVGWRVSVKSSNYLMERGITPQDCKRYNIGSTKLYQKYSNYVLIPIFDGEKIRGFLGRYGAKKVPKNKLRYNNSIGTKFAELLFGFDEINNKTNTVILVEGVFDKIAVDKVLQLFDSDEIKCVCTFGKKISREQIKKLMAKKVTNVVLLYDFDAIKNTKRYGLELEKNFITTITYTTKKDIDECTREEALEVFTRLKRPSSFCEDVVGKLKK